MDAERPEPRPSLPRGLWMFLGGAWIAFYCVSHLIGFIRTGLIDWPHMLGKGSPETIDPIPISYAARPIWTTVTVVITSMGGLIGLAGVVLGLRDIGKSLNS
jgi:hypothetical protein